MSNKDPIVVAFDRARHLEEVAVEAAGEARRAAASEECIVAAKAFLEEAEAWRVLLTISNPSRLSYRYAVEYEGEALKLAAYWTGRAAEFATEERTRIAARHVENATATA